MSKQPPKNPFVYGKVMTASDAACPRPALETRVKQTVRDDARLALVGDRRMGKSSIVNRTLQGMKVPMLRLNYYEVLDLADVINRTVADLERFLRERSVIARKVVPWLREVGLEIREIRASMSGFELKAAAGIPTDSLKRVFGIIRDASARTAFTLFIDELQDIPDRLPEAVANATLAIMRDEIQQMSKTPVFYAGSSRDSFTCLFTSDSSPLYEQAQLANVEAIPEDEMLDFIQRQFLHGHKIEPEAAALIVRIAGDSPNDIQHLCYEVWNEHLGQDKPATTAIVQRAFDKLLRDITPFGEKWLSDFSIKQQRIVFCIAFQEHLGAGSREFLEFAGLRNPGDVGPALATAVKGKEALLEKVGSRYRFRSRFVRLWFALRYYRVQALIPAMRTVESYRLHLNKVLPALPTDPLIDLAP